MLLTQDINDLGELLHDISAHILRRNRASIQCIFLGYSRIETALSLGHKIDIPKATKERSKTLEFWNELACKNTRYDIFSNVSLHPKHQPIVLTDGLNLDIPPFEEILAGNNSAEILIVDISIAATTCGNTITTELDGAIQKNSSNSTNNLQDKKTQSSNKLIDWQEFANTNYKEE